jgi:uncharacterized membrane protein YqjE
VLRDSDREAHHEPGEPSVTSSIERMVIASQNVISKKIDLAVLEGQEWITRAVSSVLLAAVGGLLACAAWLSLVACIALALPESFNTLGRAAVFTAVNVIAAILMLRPVLRRVSPRETAEAARHGGALAGARGSEGNRG